MPSQQRTVELPRLPDAAWKRSFRRQLQRWFDQHARDLPWRRTTDLYRIWVSEIMLQQTQVQTVVPYYERFVSALPDVAALAAASEQQVLRLWEGLGYYRRARQLHQAAKHIIQRHGGQLPQRPAELMELPGIGRYTAGAILSIALGSRQPILEANTLRLLSRLLAFRGDPRSSVGRDLLWTMATELLPRHGVGRFNQALMELGSQICTRVPPPRCERCPIRTLCPTKRLGLQNEIPVPKQKKVYTLVHEAAVIVRRNGTVLLRRYEPGERFAGLWDFPRFATPSGQSTSLEEEVAAATATLTGVRVAAARPLTTLKHAVTRYRITLTCYQADYAGGRKRPGALRWVALDQLTDVPLSATGRRISKLLLAEG